jgi:hypothetical protein
MDVVMDGERVQAEASSVRQGWRKYCLATRMDCFMLCACGGQRDSGAAIV